MLNKRHKYNIDSKAADEALKNVFAACDTQPNDKPLHLIRAWNIANTATAKLGFWISILLLMLILAMPLAFRNQAGSTNSPMAISSQSGVERHYYDEVNGCFVMILYGDDIDYNGVYAKTDDGEIILPVEANETTRRVGIPFKEGNLNIYIPKMDGTVIQAVLSR